MIDVFTGILVGILGIGVLMFLIGIRIVRPIERGVVETLGKFDRVATPGFVWVFPLIQRMIKVNTTERMVEIDTQEIITEDSLNAKVDMVIYYKVKKDEDSVKKSIYEVQNFKDQITILGQTTARNVIGEMIFKDVNSKRNNLNTALAKILKTETSNWGVDIVRVELRDINPPADVQATMNQVIKAQNEKRAAVDFATAAETVADGKKRSAIKEAEGLAQGKVIVAEAEAKKIKLINESAEKYFVGNAQKLKQLETMQASLQNNSKIILTEKGIKPQLLVGNLTGDKND